jgi:acyl-CoA thioesterase
MAIVLRAMAAAVPHPDAVSATGYYLSPCHAGPLEVAVEPLRSGRAHSTASARLIQEGETRLQVTATFGDLGAARGPTAVTGDRPAFPPPDACVRAEGPPAPEFAARFDLRLTPESAMWAIGHPSGVARMDGWVRFADGREPDTASLPLFADALPPAILNVLVTRWVPTFELTVHVRGRPAPGWLQARFETRYLMDGYLEEDGEIWDSTGRLVALSRQLAQVQPDA